MPLDTDEIDHLVGELAASLGNQHSAFVAAAYAALGGCSRRIEFCGVCRSPFSIRQPTLAQQIPARGITDRLSLPTVRRLMRTAPGDARMRAPAGCGVGGDESWDIGVAGKLSRIARPRRRTFSGWPAMRFIVRDCAWSARAAGAKL